MPIKKRRKLSAYINVRLSEKDDQDLINWWATLPPGAGGTFVKSAIRAQLDQPVAPVTNNTIIDAVNWQDARAAERAEQAEKRIAELAAQVGSLAAQLAGLAQRVANGVSVVATSAPPDEEQPQLTTEQQAARLKKVVSQKW